MTRDETIFGLRFHSNETIQPSIEDLKLFLDSRAKNGARYGDALAAYRALLATVEAGARGKRSPTTVEEYRAVILLGVLGHSQLVKPALMLAAEQYLYHLSTLAGLDFRKPESFIKSAEAEIAKLNPKKKDEAARRSRMEGMIDERKQDLAKLTRRRAALAEELGHIADYVADNLERIEKLCEASITALVGDQLGGAKEQELIEDLKSQFKNQLRDHLHSGTITKEQMEQAREDVAALSGKISEHLREDAYALTGLYENIHERVADAGKKLRTLRGELAGRKKIDFDDEVKLYGKIEAVLLALVADPGFTARIQDVPVASEHDALVFEKRQEMLAHLFDLLKGPLP